MFIGSRVKELRKKKGLTQTELGKLINVTKVSISCYEHNNRIPNLDTFIDLVEVLETTPDYLLGRDVNVIAQNDEKYSIVLPNLDMQIIKEIRNIPSLHSFLLKNPKRGVEYLNKKIV